MAGRGAKRALQQVQHLRAGVLRAHYSVSTASRTTTPEAETSDSTSTAHKKILVLGGNGYVGSHICQEALASHIPVASLSRSGAPGTPSPWCAQVDWIKGDLFHPATWDTHLRDVSAIVSCVGGFGSNEQMHKINGTANVLAIRAAADAGVKRFVYVSAHDFGLPGFVLGGYYSGKRAAEDELLAKFPYSGVILRPGFIHGVRQVGRVKVPLNAIGLPLEVVLKRAKMLERVPVVGKLLVPPVKVASVARAAVRAATDNAVPPGVMDVWGIMRLGGN